MDNDTFTDYRNCAKTGKKKIPEKNQFNSSADTMYAPGSEDPSEIVAAGEFHGASR